MIPFSPDSSQTLLCLAAGGDATVGQLQRFERAPSGHWRAIGETVPVTLGRAGLAWGRGLHPVMPGRTKCEGDGRAPAGVFAITAMFGYDAAACLFGQSARLPFFRASRNLKCIDDPVSQHYNAIVDQSAVAAVDWTSSEDMQRADDRYALGAVVGHNTSPSLAGCGSCIFLHVWASSETPTAGCTAMSLANMTEIATWLDGAALPVLVQLPQAEYERLRQDWLLPGFAAPV